MTHKGTVTLESERLLLKKFTMEDVPFAYKNWTSDAQVTKFLRWPTHKNIETTEKVFCDWIEKYCDKSFYQWGIFLKDSNELVGTISVVDKNEELNIVHIGYCIGSKWWHKGITSEAFSTIIPFLFNEVGVNRIESQHDPRNPNSGKVMKKCGLKYEGTLRQADISNQGIVDASMYSLLKDEWLSMKK